MHSSKISGRKVKKKNNTYFPTYPQHMQTHQLDRRFGAKFQGRCPENALLGSPSFRTSEKRSV
jgi:hypothetical protein